MPKTVAAEENFTSRTVTRGPRSSIPSIASYSMVEECARLGTS